MLIARGSYRPPTLVQQDMIRCAHQQFQQDAENPNDEVFFLTEITLDNLVSDGHLDERDFLDRATVLSALGQTVVISNFSQHKHLIAYFSDYRVQRIGVALGVRKLQHIVTETCRNNPRNLLGAFGEIFLQNVRFYIYPALPLAGEKSDAAGFMNVHNIEIPPGIRFLYQYLLDNKNIQDIEGVNPQVLDIHHKEVLQQIQQGQTDWINMVPPEVADLIREKGLFQQKALPWDGRAVV